MLREKGSAILSLIVLMVILAAVGAGVYLVQHPQILKSRANLPPIVLKDTNGVDLPQKDGKPYTTSPKVKVVLTSPLGFSSRVLAATTANGITGSILGPSSGVVGQTLKYTAKGESEQGEGYVSIHWAKTTSDITKRESWNQIAKSDLIRGFKCWVYAVSGLECTVDAFFTPQEAGEYYVSVVVTDKGVQCSGNPKYDAVSGWTDCGGNDLITLTVASPSVSPIPSISPSPTPSEAPISTTHYKIAESPTDLDNASLQAYTSHPMVIDYEFKAQALGVKFIWVEFIASDGKKDRQVAQVELVSQTLGKKTLRGVECGEINVSVSRDNNNQFSDAITMNPSDVRYYFHAVSAADKDVNCSANFEVLSGYCELGMRNCHNFDAKVWGPYKTGDDGVARIDFPNPKEGVYVGKFRPLGSNVGWSDEITVTYDKASSKLVVGSAGSIDMTQYYIYEPGYVWIYTSKNNLTDKSGLTRVQVEQETDVCGVRVKPWRYTKDLVDAYWNPAYYNTKNPNVNGGGVRDLRWMVVSPNYNYSAHPGFNNFIWAYSDLRYRRDSIRDINQDKPLGGYTYINKSGTVPGYNLAPKRIDGRVYYDFSDGQSSFLPSFPCTDPVNSSLPRYTSWKIRVEIEKNPITVNNLTFNDVIRVDMYEGGTPMETADNLLRESWYFAKGVGVIKILTKEFNNYGGMGYEYALKCSEDSDCLNDTMVNPHTRADLLKYYQNPTLNVSVVKAQEGYDLKINNVDYTGYLEAKDKEGRVFKWQWAENGVAHVTTRLENASFRIWIPNEQFPNETRVSPVDLPWSNAITINP